MPITQSLNSKANVKKFTNQDLPFAPQQPVISSYYAVSTAGQTVINLSFSVDTVNLTDQFFLFVDGKKLRLGASNDYTFTSIANTGYSSQVTLNQALPINLNIQAYQLGLKKEAEFLMDNRFVQLYEAQGSGFQGFVNQTSFLSTATSTAGTPVAGTFYSTISNRAAMADLSQNLKANMGVDRLMTQQVYLIQNEFGPAGENVYGVINDLFGQVRFVGQIAASNGNGPTIFSSITGDFMEITFYGTGLNLLMALSANANRGITYSVDGGTVSGNIYPSPSTVSGATNGRGYTSQSTVSVVNGLTLGIHTVKITNSGSASDGLAIQGFDVLTETANVLVNPGVSYLQNKKYTSASQGSFAYNADVTGTRGGRVLVYQNGDGTIGRAWQAVNAAQATFASADHTNEEIARVYNYREFSASRSDDFSVVNTQNKAFTLEDDNTTLSGVGVTIDPSGLLYVNTSGNTIAFTFTGTGLDIFNNNGAQPDGTYNMFLDNVQIATNITGASIQYQRTTKIVSGLPYGTHVLRVTATNSASTATFCLGRMIVYQPKKPTLPSGAVELADYNVPATYAAAAAATRDSISTGVIRKMSMREALYVGAGWVQNGLEPQNFNSGFNFASSTSGNYVEYTFFGTGVEFHGLYGAPLNFTVSIDGSSNLSGFTNGFTYAGTGLTYTASTGTVSGTGSITSGLSVRVSGLTLGKHTIRVTNNSTSLYVDCFDVIVPMHSTKSNTPTENQNAFPVGSQSISDNRKSTPVKDLLPSGKAWAQAFAITSSPSTSSTSFVPLAEMSTVIKVAGNSIVVSYSVTGGGGGSNAFEVIVLVNGLQFGQPTRGTGLAGGVDGTVANRMIVPVGPGTHKVDLYYRATGGSVTMQGIQRTLLVEEK